ncbi:SDR family NAD(P)-dependent oxidoreductase, partial [Symbioplanes lichenis]|uniref:SDR family NAD(P)-dependent oxidoreductase n=1 Tax=Symbioplanes lichenis TaxID=1629072 RepID=UPI002738C280
LMDTAEWGAAYWYRNLRTTVQFAQALQAAAPDVVIEVSPHPVLLPAVQDIAPAIGTLRRGEGDQSRLTASLAQAWTHGVDIDWTGLFAGHAATRVPLPTYPFERHRFWPETAESPADVTAAGLSSAEHPLLGAMVPLPHSDGVLFTSRLSLRTHPWLADHAVRGTVIFPATGHVELAVRAGDSVGCDRLDELVLEAPLVLPAQGGVQVQVVVDAGEDQRPVTIYARPDGQEEWTRHASGLLSAGAPEPGSEFDPVRGEWPGPGATALDTSAFYEQLAADGFLLYGPMFQGLTRAWRHGDRILTEVEVPAGARAESYGIHPALLDAALHATVFAELDAARTGGLPFSFTDVTLRASGATRLRVALTRTGPDQVTIAVADATGLPVLAIGSLAVRPASATGSEAATGDGALVRMTWTEVAATGAPVHDWLLVERPGALPSATPDQPVVLSVASDASPVVAATHELTAWVLDQLQHWLRTETATPLVVWTRGAVAAYSGEIVTDLPAAAVWGLVRSAQSENPGRFVLLDTDTAVDPTILGRALAAGEPQLSLRGGQFQAARLARVGAADELTLPDEPWRLGFSEPGTLDNLALLPSPDATRPLEPHEVRLEVRAAGLNFRDVLNALGMYPGEPGPLGSEAAGVIVETGSAVTGLRVGDRVMGLAFGAFGPLVVTDHRLLVAMPADWSFTTAASVPIVFLTAWYGLVDLAGLQSGESVLIHAGAGGVGLAALQIARHLGAEVFATAGPAKWPVLHEWGLTGDHVASSRDLVFHRQFTEATGGRGVDVVLNALAGEFVDASLDTLAPGGRFVEMGKTDIRSPEQLRDRYPGIGYQAFELMEAGAERVQAMLRELAGLFATGTLRPLPVADWDVRQARDAFRFMSQARHVGKLVLTVPATTRPALDPAGTVVITGGGGLGGLAARRLAQEYGVRHLLLVSRRGDQAPGVPELVAELAGQRVTARAVACDLSDREALAGVLAAVPPEHPVTGVVHTAAVLADGVIGSLTRDQLDEALAPKVDAVWHLHELTRGLDLAMFVVYSSLAGHLGSAGQGNYAAANVFLDALMRRRRREGRPGLSLAWGAWTTEVGRVGQLSGVDLERITRSAMPPLGVEQGMELFDRALRSSFAVLGPARLNPRALRGQADVAPLWRTLAGAAPRRATAGTGRGGEEDLGQRLAGLSRAERDKILTDLVRRSAATVLGHASAARIDADRSFSELGFDSLTSVELRNLLRARTGRTLSSGVVFDYPTVTQLAGYVDSLFAPAEPLPQEQPAPRPDDHPDEADLLDADVDDLINIALRDQ